MNKKILFRLSGLFFVVFQLSCTQESLTDLTQTAFIPKPVSVTATGKSFDISDLTTIYFQEGKEDLKTTGQYFAEQIDRIADIEPEVRPTSEVPIKGIYLTMDNDSELGNEGYEITIDKRLITIKANGTAGCFYAVQTLLQTLPVENKPGQPLLIATGTIHDFPEYGYRGAMLDVARHFFSVDDVKQFIDYLATYKMNILHLHLSDDQGWRIEIKSWPKLTEIGGSTEVGGGKGGFYTQEQYSDIVKYAQDRQITIIPEIDMPGHTNAALASYAELNCNGKATKLYTGTDVGFSTLCTNKEITYKFIDDVVRELAAITPGPYIHIGGDESHVTPMKDYIPFVNRVQEIVTSHGKKVIGWDEIANATLVKDAAVQYWADDKNTTKGVEQGAKVVMSPAAKAYIDMQYDSTTTLGLHWAGYIEVNVGYNWDPATLVPGITKENILGVEAPLWTETIKNLKDIQYMVFPRLPGYAEIGWTATKARNWDEYKTRLAQYGKRFKDLGIDYYPSKLVPWGE